MESLLCQEGLALSHTCEGSSAAQSSGVIYSPTRWVQGNWRQQEHSEGARKSTVPLGKPTVPHTHPGAYSWALCSILSSAYASRPVSHLANGPAENTAEKGKKPGVGHPTASLKATLRRQQFPPALVSHL